MTDRVNALTVALEKDIRIDDVEFLINAIKALRFVSNVEPRVTDISDYVAKNRADRVWREALYDLLRNPPSSREQS